MNNKNNKKEKNIAILAVILIVFVAIVFSKITGNYIAEKALLIYPNRGDFIVVFSSNPTKLETNLVAGYPVNNMNTYGVISNNKNPKITNLSAKLTKPGDYVTYNFYIMNLGNYDAYLTDIIYNFFEGTDSFKKCSSNNITDVDLKNACDSIELEVKINDGFKNVTVNNTEGINNHILRKRTSEPISVTIKYLNNGYEINSPLDIKFSDIDIYYKLVNKK